MDVEGLCEYLEWDSDFFGCDIARLTAPRVDAKLLGSVDDWCRSHGIDCLYFLCDSHDAVSIHTAENHDFRLVDRRLTLVHNLQRVPAEVDEAGAACVRQCTPQDLPSLRAIARTSHTDSRFYHDGNFSRSRCDALYETWVEKSCHATGEAVIVAELNSRAVGYATCLRPEPEAGQLGLLAVAAEARGRGLGRILIEDALRLFIEQGVARVTVVTQGRNTRAQRLYEKSGFVLSLAQHWYHRWYPVAKTRIAAWPG
jgi:dTDP-4-amino-4,6-dideoxy-D-galactose acyltransferase